ncbi:MAG TPA: LysE family translocator [Streptosporangiaceae bacterium]|nr:LysE family translocator [Streptosporangiaceae bacterium]
MGVTKNTLAGGRRRGRFTAAGVGTSNAVQGAVAVSGLSAVILQAQPVFTAIKWAGVCYLAVLGIQSLVSALRGQYDLPAGEQGVTGAGTAFGGWRQGFLSNITNPKVLIFYIAVLPPVPPARRRASLAARLRVEPRRAVAGLPDGPEHRPRQDALLAGQAPGPPGDGHGHGCGAARVQRPAGSGARLSFRPAGALVRTLR